MYKKLSNFGICGEIIALVGSSLEEHLIEENLNKILNRKGFFINEYSALSFYEELDDYELVTLNPKKDEIFLYVTVYEDEIVNFYEFYISLCVYKGYLRRDNLLTKNINEKFKLIE